jgi:hypothetical protein
MDSGDSGDSGLIAVRLSDGFAKQNPGIIAQRLSDGLGNRLFQCAALLGYAERWNRRPALFPSQIHPCNHADALLAHKLFPQLELAWNTAAWEKLTENPADYATYKPFTKPLPAENAILLHGYFQTERYFPSYPIVLSFESVLSAERRAFLNLNYRDYGWWIHVRLGDYMALPHYQVGIAEYLRKVVAYVPAGERVLVFSDSPGLALAFLQTLPTAADVEWVAADPGLTPLETLYAMRGASRGCICTNSTFSWWGAYGSVARSAGAPIYFPGRWSALPYAADDIYPQWGTKVDY